MTKKKLTPEELRARNEKLWEEIWLSRDLVTFQEKYGSWRFLLTGTWKERKEQWGKLCLAMAQRRIREGLCYVPDRKDLKNPGERPPATCPDATPDGAKKWLASIEMWEKASKTYSEECEYIEQLDLIRGGDIMAAVAFIEEHSNYEYEEYEFDSLSKIEDLA